MSKCTGYKIISKRPKGEDYTVAPLPNFEFHPVTKVPYTVQCMDHTDCDSDASFKYAMIKKYATGDLTEQEYVRKFQDRASKLKFGAWVSKREGQDIVYIRSEGKVIQMSLNMIPELLIDIIPLYTERYGINDDLKSAIESVIIDYV